MVLSRRRLAGGNCFKNLREQAQEFPHLSAGDEKWRQQADGVIVSAIDQQAAIHRFGDQRRAVNGQLDADHQAFAPDFADKVEAPRQSRDAFAQLGAKLANVE